jgi:signal transduction histidine kinase/CheY-like chemotaxis protein
MKERMGWRYWLPRNLALAVIYLVTALVSYRFYDPAAVATAIFPSAGVALAAILVWGWRAVGGVFLGSALLNLILWTTSHAPLTALGIAPWIGVGASLQALVGGLLCRRFALITEGPKSDWHELRLILLGGPLACFISPVVGCLGLYLCGRLADTDVLFNIWTWWVGDTVGVVIFTPLILQVLQRRYRRVENFWWALTAPLLAFAVVLLLFLQINREEQRHLESGFRDQARALVQRLDLRLQGHVETLHSIRRFWQSSQQVDAGEFQRFVAESLASQPDMRLLAWAPAHGNKVALNYIQPGPQRLLLGLDLRADPVLRAVLEQARHSGALAASSGLDGFVAPSLRNSVVLLLPLYANGVEAAPPRSERGRTFIGVIMDAFDVDSLIRAIPAMTESDGLLFRIEDVGAAVPLIHQSAGRPDDKPLQWQSSLELGQRQWRVTVTSPAGYRAAHRSLQPSLAMLGILLFVGLLQALLFTMRRSQKLRVQTLRAEHARTVAEQTAQVKSRFLATMSHEIRTPMNGVIGMTQLLSETPMNTEQKHFVSTIHRSCEVLLRIINDILDYSKIEAGRLEVEQAPFDLPALLQECVSLFSLQSRDSGVPLLLKIADDVPREIVGDSVRIRQVLINLLDNAYKFTRKGSVTLNVRCHGKGGTAYLYFEVKDTGIGIADIKNHHLFEPFSQADSSITRKYGGTGLGLSICRLLVQLMQGEIGVESRSGHGSIFWFKLPVILVKAETVEPAEAGRDTSGELSDGMSHDKAPLFSGLRALVVEDNPVNQMVIVGLLKKQGVEVQTVSDGVEALQTLIAERQAFDVVFMDCEMPNMDGYTATRRLRQWEDAEMRVRMVICGVSAHVLPEFKARALTAGMNEFLAKPLRLEELCRVLAMTRNVIVA